MKELEISMFSGKGNEDKSALFNFYAENEEGGAIAAIFDNESFYLLPIMGLKLHK